VNNVEQKIERIGRLAAVFSSLILSALLFNLWVLNATANEPSPKIAETEAENYMMPAAPKRSMVQRVIDVILQTGTATAAIPSSEFAEDLVSPRFLKPVAFVYMDQLYLVSKTGRIIGSADSSDVYDLPIISGDAFEVDSDGKRLIDETSKQALALLADIQRNYALEPILSEIRVKDDNVIAYLNIGKVMPVIFGQGAWEQKINKFISYQKQLGASELTREARYLDLRVENRIVVKKNV
jgi:hypothetical protein